MHASGLIGRRRAPDHRGDDGFSMIATGLSLVATALLTALLLSATLHSGGHSTTSVTNAPGVAQADHLEAQSALSTALSSAEATASTVGGYGSLTPASLSGENPAVGVVAGPSTDASTISMSVSAGTGAGAVTLADRSPDGVCWLVWKSAAGPTWFGAQTHATSCTAPPLSTPPVPGSASASTIGWQPGSFPSV